MDIMNILQSFKNILEQQNSVSLQPTNLLNETKPALPAKELITEFESILAQKDTTISITVEPNQSSLASYLPHSPTIYDFLPVSSPQSVQNITPKEYLIELQEILNTIENATPTPQQLYRLQYISSLLHIQIVQFNNVLQNQTQQFDILLKQQG